MLDVKGNQMLRKTMLALFASSLAFAAAACNTVEGAGEDLQSVSQTTEEAIN